MAKNVRALALATLTIGILSAVACSEDGVPEGEGTPTPAAHPPLPGGDAAVPDAGSVPSADASTDASDAGAARFGLEARPSNTTCVAPARPPAAGAVTLQRVYANVALSQTIAMAQPPGDKTRWFAASRTGIFSSFPAVNPPSTPTPVANVASLAGRPVETDKEGGFLGFAFHPKFSVNGRIYVTFTTTDAGGPASEVGYLTSTDGGASFTSYTKIFGFNRTRFEHNGGGIAFDKEGFLLLGFGDMANDTHGQRLHTFSARVLRLDVDHPADGKPYGIPNGNPWKGGGIEPPEVFATGVRNPFRLSVDRATGEIWLGDVGQDNWEEVDKIEAGLNYGWPCREGMHDHKATDNWLCPSLVGLTEPVIEYAHVPPGASVTGGVVYRGAAMPAFQGTYLYGDFMQLSVSATTFDPFGAPTTVQLNAGGPTIASTHFAEDGDGEVYVSGILQNEIFKLVPTVAAPTSTFPDLLSKTGCFEATNPKQPILGLVPYGVNTPLWSDGATKERHLALPNGTTIGIGTDGDFDLPIGSVLTKTFSLAGKRVETRLFVRHDDGEWAGYSYEWNDAETDASLLASAKTKTVGTQTWSFPSRTQCLTCHTAAAGRTLGLELAQLNGDHLYPTTNRTRNQLETLEHIGMFTSPLGALAAISAYPAPFGGGALDARARAYLHGNCSMCHRPNGGAARAPMDFRFATTFKDVGACGVASVIDDLGVTGAKILAPGAPASSLISLRVHATNNIRMPPLGSRVVDPQGAALLDAWITGVLTCPP